MARFHQHRPRALQPCFPAGGAGEVVQEIKEFAGIVPKETLFVVVGQGKAPWRGGVAAPT
jgi:hypothetical protein